MSIQSAPIEAAFPRLRNKWAWHIGAFATVIAVTLALFRFEAVSAVQVWWVYPTYSHCFLVLPIVLWLVWNKRNEIPAPKVNPAGLLLLLPVLAAWLAGYFANINELRQFAVVGIIEVAAFVFLGWRTFKAVAFPLLYLLFLVPFGQYLIPPMQLFAADFTDRALTISHIPHYTEGTIIDLPGGRFEIAEACAGLRFLIATLALGVLFAHLAYQKWWKTAVFLIACVAVPLVANGLRCAGTIALAYVTNNAAAVEADHIIYGLGFNVAILLILLLGGIRFRDPMPAARAPAAQDKSRPDHMRLVAACVVLSGAIAAAPAFAYWRDSEPANLGARAIATIAIPGWNETGGTGNWHPSYFAPARKLETTIAKNGAPAGKVDVAIWYYDHIRPGRSLVDWSNHVWNEPDWHKQTTDIVGGDIGIEPVQFTETVLSSPAGHRLVWSCYWIDSRFAANATLVKLLQLKTMALGPSGGAMIAFSTPFDVDVETARRRLQSAASAFGELRTALNSGLSEPAAGAR